MRNEDKVTCTCEVCGKIFPYRHGYRTKTCSKECEGKIKSENFKKRVTRICKNCGKEYEVRPYEKKEFCCMDCYWEYRRKNAETEYKDVFKNRVDEAHEVRKCEHCGKEFYVYKKTKKRFCSDECRNAYIKTRECTDKRIKTMLEKYGRKSPSKGWTEKQKADSFKKRDEKYQALCKKSDLTFIKYVDRHKLLVKCNKCGYEFVTNNLSYIHYDKIICKLCGKEYKYGKPTMKIVEFLRENNIKFKLNDRTVINPLEIDILLEDYNIGIEVNGNFWHSERCGKDKLYHLNKTLKCHEKGVKLLHFFEDEILYKFDIVKNMISNILNLKEKIFIYDIAEIDNETMKKFVENNSLEEYNEDNDLNLAVRSDMEIIFALSVKMKENICEIRNVAETSLKCVDNGFAVILKHIIGKYNPKEITCFSDVRLFGVENDIYKQNGFVKDGIEEPRCWTVKKNDFLKRIPINETIYKQEKIKVWNCGEERYILKHP